MFVPWKKIEEDRRKEREIQIPLELPLPLEPIVQERREQKPRTERGVWSIEI